jgi:hypothetical protein
MRKQEENEMGCKQIMQEIENYESRRRKVLEALTYYGSEGTEEDAKRHYITETARTLYQIEAMIIAKRSELPCFKILERCGKNAD